jgi:hypothetical protein
MSDSSYYYICPRNLLYFNLTLTVSLSKLHIPFCTYSEPQSPSPARRSFSWTCLNVAN